MLGFADMKAGTFKGGIHPSDGKNMSKDKPRLIIEPKGLMVYPTVQHIGAPAIPIVKPGDKVLAGQKIAEAGGFVSACVISTVSGIVKALEPRLTVGGNEVLSIVVENDGEYKTIEGIGEKRDYKKLSKEEIRTLIKEAGIVGLGGAGFPTHVKLTPKDDNAIDYVIINAAECEPYLTSDYRMMLEEPHNIVAGLKIVLRLLNKAKGIIAVEDNKPDAIEKLTIAAKDDSRISVMPIKTKYPQGGERVLIYAATGRQINSGMLPADAGCVVNNTATMIAIYMAVTESTPLMFNTVTVTGDAVSKPGNYIVRTGMSHEELMQEAGGFISTPKKIISGGPMMGMSMYDLNVPIVKTSSSILAFTKDTAEEIEPGPCIRCGRCLTVCPGRIAPLKIMEAAEQFKNETFEALSGMECCECGCCTYICPARRRLTQSFKQMRKSVMDERKKNASKKP